MKALLITPLLFFFAFTSSRQGSQINNYSLSQNANQNNIDNDIIRATNNGNCKKAKFLVITNGITSGNAYEAYKNCKLKPKEGKTSSALEFDPETDDLSPLPPTLKPIDNNYVKLGNDAFNKGSFGLALQHYKYYMVANRRIFLNEQNEDWLETYVDKVTYCRVKLNLEKEEEKEE